MLAVKLVSTVKECYITEHCVKDSALTLFSCGKQTEVKLARIVARLLTVTNVH